MLYSYEFVCGKDLYSPSFLFLPLSSNLTYFGRDAEGGGFGVEGAARLSRGSAHGSRESDPQGPGCVSGGFGVL